MAFYQLKASSHGGDDHYRLERNSDKSINEKLSRPSIYEEKPSIHYCLPPMTSVLFATVLEDCIQQLSVLCRCNNEMRIMKTMADMASLRTEKYQIKPMEDEDAILKFSWKQLESNEFKLDKLFNDRKFFGDVLVRTYLQMAYNGCYSELRTAIKELEDKNKYQCDIIEEEASNRILRHELLKQLRHQRNQMKSTIYDTDVMLNQLRSQVEDTTLNSEIRGRYIENWQRAREEQHDQQIYDTEAGSSVSINYYQTRTDQEQRAHSEIELLVNICITETLTKVEDWMNKFDTDMEAKDLQIAIMKNKYQDTLNKRIELEETYAAHEVLQNNWLQFKKERQAAIDYRNKMTNSAIVVQAWWRGLLVRLEMGPYKPSKKPKGKKKKE